MKNRPVNEKVPQGLKFFHDRAVNQLTVDDFAAQDGPRFHFAVVSLNY